MICSFVCRGFGRPGGGRLLLSALLWMPLAAQSWTLVRSPRLELPVRPDGNSATFWAEGAFHVFTSTGQPLMISTGGSQFTEWESQPVDVSAIAHVPLWIEAAQRVDGVLFGWYHHEPGGVCGSIPLTSPKIGAVISWDNGESIADLGVVLDSPYPPDCAAKNGFFAGGHGDFSVIPDRRQEYFYFFFTNYSGPREEQGICMARLKWSDRFNPAGNVWKYFEGKWEEPGLGGRCTPVFPARVEWQRADTDSFWGPAVHYNTYLRRYVMLLNRSCCEPGWPQEGIYVSFSTGGLDSADWTEPVKLLDREDIGFLPGYYPQVIGIRYGETDTLASQQARLYISGISDWTITFSRPPFPRSPASGGGMAFPSGLQ
jgi:hypothetical protein